RDIFRTKILQPEAFLELCGITQEEFDALETPDLDYLLDERYAPPQKSIQPGEKGERQKPVKKNRTPI
ncbi:MAG: hypothetical protein IJZ37_06110, partial [Clostridia bacterium]|nr:hypothetical protein [Clostridia bacterium]